MAKQGEILEYLAVNTTENSTTLWNYRQRECAFWTEYLPTVIGYITPTYPPTTEVSTSIVINLLDHVAFINQNVCHFFLVLVGARVTFANCVLVDKRHMFGVMCTRCSVLSIMEKCEKVTYPKSIFFFLFLNINYNCTQIFPGKQKTDTLMEEDR